MTKEEAWEHYIDNYPDRPYTTQQIFGIAWDMALKSVEATLPLTEKENDVAVTPDASTPPFNDILKYLNEVTGKNYRPTMMHKAHIRARWNEGYTIEDFKKVCDTMFKEWDHDPKMRPYLRPETLFNSKFDSYLNRESKRTQTPDWM